MNGTRKASKHWQEYSSDKLVTNMLFQLTDINPCIYKRFLDNLDLEQHGDDFLLCGLTSNLECWDEPSYTNHRDQLSCVTMLRDEVEFPCDSCLLSLFSTVR